MNVAARLERAKEVIGTRICVSESAVAQVPSFVGRPVGMLLLTGKTQPLKCFEPLAPGCTGASSNYSAAFALL